MSPAFIARNALLAFAAALTGCHDGAAGRVDGAPCSSDDECRSESVCAHQRCTIPCQSDVDCGEGHCLAGACSTEVCNFADDDGNGEVDEGWDWNVSPWVDFGLTHGRPTVVHAVALDDDRVVVAASIDPSITPFEGNVAVGLADGHGATLMDFETTQLHGIAHGPATLAMDADTTRDELLLAFPAGDAVACASGCELRLVLRRASSLAPISDRSVQPAFSFASVFALRHLDAGWVLAAGEPAIPPYGHAGRVHVVRLMDDLSGIATDVALDGADTTAVTLLATDGGVAWVRASSAGLTQLGVVDVTRGTVVERARTLAQVDDPIAASMRATAVLEGGDVVIATVAGGRGATDVDAALISVATSSSSASPAFPLDLRGTAPFTGLTTSPGAAFVGVGTDRPTVIARIGRDLEPVVGPSGPTLLAGGSEVFALVRVGRGLLALTRLGGRDPGGSVSAAWLGCR